MGAVLQKIKADITSRRLLSALITVTIVAASALLTLAIATLMNSHAPYDKSFDELNGAHLWLYFNRDKIRPYDIEQIETMPGVAQSTGLQHSAISRVKIHDTRVWVSLRVMPPEQPAINRLFVREGHYMAAHQVEVLASKDLNDLYNLAVGNTIGITRRDGKTVNVPVIGLAYNPMWDTYRNTQPPYLYVTEETMRKLFPDESTWDWSIGLRLTDPEAVTQTLAAIEAMLRPEAIQAHTDWREVRDTATFDARISFVFLGAFSLFAIVATVLVMVSSIGSIVLSQFRQIGILKAVGFTQQQILWLYVGQYMALGLLGSPVGLLLGFILAPLPLKSIAVSLGTPYQPSLDLALIALVLGTIAGIIILSTWGAANMGAKANIIRSIAIGVEAPRKKLPWGVRLAERLNLPMVFVLGLNDIFTRPFRSLLTGFNLTLGVIGIVFGLALNETLDAYKANPALLGIVYDASVTRELTSDSKTRYLLDRAPGVAAFYGEYLTDAKTLAGQSFKVRAVEGSLSDFAFTISKGRFFRPNTYEAIAGRGLLNWLGLEVGDTLTLIFEDKPNRPIKWQIVGEYLEPINRGQLLMVNLSALAQHVRPSQPSTYFLKLAPDCDTVQLKHYLEPKPDADLNLTIVGQKIPSYILYLQLAILALSVILIGIALVNVFNTSLLAMREKVRAIGILKTIGMTPLQVIMMGNTTAGLLGLGAALLGMPLGLLFTQQLLDALANNFGFSQVQVFLKFFYILALPPLMVGISMLGSSIPGRQAAKLSIIQVLRNE